MSNFTTYSGKFSCKTCKEEVKTIRIYANTGMGTWMCTESKRIGARQHKNSGRNTKKGDATWRDFVVDFKESSKSFTINKDVWAKAVTDSIKAGTDKSPAIVVVLGEGNQKTRLAIIEFDLLDQLTWEAKNGAE